MAWAIYIKYYIHIYIYVNAMSITVRGNSPNDDRFADRETMESFLAWSFLISRRGWTLSISFNGPPLVTSNSPIWTSTGPEWNVGSRWWYNKPKSGLQQTLGNLGIAPDEQFPRFVDGSQEALKQGWWSDRLGDTGSQTSRFCTSWNAGLPAQPER